MDSRDGCPEDGEGLRPSRPDRAVQMKAVHAAAEFKRLLEQRLARAGDPVTEWSDHEAVVALDGRTTLAEWADAIGPSGAGVACGPDVLLAE